MFKHFNINPLYMQIIGYPIKLSDNMILYGFCLIISVKLQSPLVTTNWMVGTSTKLDQEVGMGDIDIFVHDY